MLVINSVQSERDLLHLGKLPFTSLRSFSINIFDMYNCSILDALLNISRFVTESIIINIYNLQTGLNSLCLQNQSHIKIHTKVFNLIDHHSSTSLDDFVMRFLTPKLEDLKLHHTLLSPRVGEVLIKEDYPLLKRLIIRNYLLTKQLTT
jgi:hypothetical protein